MPESLRDRLLALVGEQLWEENRAFDRAAELIAGRLQAGAVGIVSWRYRRPIKVGSWPNVSSLKPLMDELGAPLRRISELPSSMTGFDHDGELFEDCPYAWGYVLPIRASERRPLAALAAGWHEVAAAAKRDRLLDQLAVFRDWLREPAHGLLIDDEWVPRRNREFAHPEGAPLWTAYIQEVTGKSRSALQNHHKRRPPFYCQDAQLEYNPASQRMELLHRWEHVKSIWPYEDCEE